jgi:beta-carotene 3-hydroxylase
MLTGVLLFLAAFVGMEVVANLAHRFIMHGPLWVLHRSHHEPGHGRFELNDFFAVFFAVPSILCIWYGTHGIPWLLPVGLGMTAYGVVYVAFHDILVHRRVPHSWLPKKGYLRRLVQAHHVHHATRTKDGAESFGFLYAADYGRRRRAAREG